MPKFLKKKMRLDEYLVEKEYFENIDIAKSNIMLGNIIVNDIKIEKAGTIIDTEKIKEIRIKGNNTPYVSRGGLKLEKAINFFELNFKDKVILDVGASTGGFTDCALQNGAKYVYAVDVGTNQLDWRLRKSQNVKSIENKHINDLTLDDIDNVTPDVIVMDISFISIKKVINSLTNFMNANTLGIFLIKPQFEAEKQYIEKGIVKDKNEHKKIILDIISYAKQEGLILKNLTTSPIRGAKGNTEYLALFKKIREEENFENLINIDEIVESI